MKSKKRYKRLIIKNKFCLIFLLIGMLLLMPAISYAGEITKVNDGNNTASINITYKQDDQKVLDGVPDIGCKAVYIAEPTTGKVIYEKNAHEKMYPASTTKILTALVVLENCKLDEKATVSQNAIKLVPSDYSNAKLKVGEEVTISDLLKALLIPSANEAANVLAEHVSGSIDDFAELCNKRAKELGCETLHFVNPNGLHDENHYCSAYDLYLIARECRKYEAFNEIVQLKSFTLPATNAYSKADRTFKNRNEMLLPGQYYYEYCTGIKTGHTNPAGECLVASSSQNDIDLISVVLGGKTVNSKGLNDRFYDTKRLFEFAYNSYAVKEIANKGDVATTIRIEKAVDEDASLDVVVNSDISTIVPADIDKESIKSSISINRDLVAPIEQNQVLGQITYYADGLEYTTDIVASHAVKKIPYEKYNIIVIVAVVLLLLILLSRAKSSKRKTKRKKRR